MKNGLVVLGLLISVHSMYAQHVSMDSAYYTPIPTGKEKPEKKNSASPGDIGYFFNLQVGPLIGCNECGDSREVTFSASTIHGITVGRKLRIGVGIGFDSYAQWQTMPVFGSLSWDIVGTKNSGALFLQTSYGSAKSWLTPRNVWGFKETIGAEMAYAQLGYRFACDDMRVSLGIGSKFQRTHARFEYPTWIPTGGTSTVVNTTEVEQELNRFMVIISVGWK
jgi:hypothetical protein